MWKKMVVTIVLALAFIFGTSSAFAQGFSAMLEKLDKLEKRLDSLTKTQQSDVNKLHAQLSKVKVTTGPDVSGLESSIVELRQMNDTLSKELEQIKANIELVDNDELTKELEQIKADIERVDNDEVLTGLVADLRGLTGELRSALETEQTALEQNAVIESSPPSQLDIAGVQTSGFVDVSYYYDGSSGGNTFGFDQAEVDLEKTIGEIGSVRADLEWVNDGEGGFALEAEQGYVTFKGLTFGKFNAPIGFELLDAPDMFQYSHALVFDYGLPTNLTGAMFSTEFSQGLDVSGYVCNGWDSNVDVNTGKTFGGRFGYSHDLGGIGLSVIHGAQNPAEGDFLTVFDVDLTATPTEGLILGGEINYGNDSVGDETANWLGFLLMAHYDFADWWGLTTRYDFFNDQDGTRLGSEVAEKRQAIAIAPTFSLGEGMGVLLEFRLDFSNKEVFTDKDGDPAKSSAGVAFEMTYTF